MRKIDVFAHVLCPGFYESMLAAAPGISEQYPFINIPFLKDQKLRRSLWDGHTEQIISYANILPEDYVGPDEAARLVRLANEELAETVRENRDMYPYGVGFVPMNNVPAALDILEEIKQSDVLAGVQLFTRALGKSIGDDEFKPIFGACEASGMPIWLHPVFDMRKPDNNIVFSWEYELSQAMLQIVQSGFYGEFPNLKIIVHHAGGLVPFFAERIHYILPPEQAADFKKFYVDTALLGNPKALDLAIDYFGADHVLFGTDAPFGIAPAGATVQINDAVESLAVSDEDKNAIFNGTILSLLGV